MKLIKTGPVIFVLGKKGKSAIETLVSSDFVVDT